MTKNNSSWNEDKLDDVKYESRAHKKQKKIYKSAKFRQNFDEMLDEVDDDQLYHQLKKLNIDDE